MKGSALLSRQRVLIGIVEFSARNEYSPTIRQIAEEVGLTRSPVHKHLLALVADGKIVAPQRAGAGWRLTKEGLAEALWARQHLTEPT